MAIILATALALIGAVLVLLYVNGADERAVAEQQPKQVYVSQEIIPAGTSLKDALRQEMIARTTVAAKGMPAGALTDVNEGNRELIATGDIAAGEYLQEARFGKTQLGTKAITVPGGMVAISVELSDPARVGSFVTPGSKIAVYETHKIVKLPGVSDADKAFNEFAFQGTDVLLDDVLVIGKGETPLTPGAAPTATDDEEQAAATSGQPSFLVTVAVSPADSVKLVHAIHSRTLYAGLRGSDVDFGDSTGVTDLTLGSMTKGGDQ
ncbi:Flp pilus assembly protein CpaB [Janibacter sp. G56]|uniref:Flp pilus assembly protein CpaB n=1 Tax=Janibacter sp. G56 TaxID=3418717 RepID=UPI003CFFEEFF